MRLRLVRSFQALSIAAVAAVAAHAGLAHAYGERLRGVAIPNIAWSSDADISSTMADIRGADFNAVRIGWKDPLKSAEAALLEASAKNLAVLVTVPLIDGPVSKEGSKARPKTRIFFPAYGLSQIDPEKLGDRIDRLLSFAVANRIRISGIEIGNELNWAGYNGDLAMPDQGQAISDMGELPDDQRARFMAGLVSYRDALKTARDVLAKHPEAGKIPLVSAGLADINTPFVRKNGATLIQPVVVHRLFVELGILDLVDVVGIHLYEPLRSKVRADTRDRKIGEQLNGCATDEVRDRPCWITEFGIAKPATDCSPDDRDRRAQMEPLIRYLDKPENAERVSATFYFDWEGGAYGLVRCGHPTALIHDLTDATPGASTRP